MGLVGGATHVADAVDRAAARGAERVEVVATGEVGENGGDIVDDAVVIDAELAEGPLRRAQEELVESSALERLLHARGV